MSAEDKNIHMAGVILAAGNSTRMGFVNKLLMNYKGHSIVAEVVKQMVNSVLDEILVITGHQHDIMVDEINKLNSSKVKTIYNPDYLKGRAGSIKKAVAHFGKLTDALLFMVADKPTVDTALIDRAIIEYKKQKPALLFVKTPNGRGHPIIFSHRLFDDLLLFEGDLAGDNLVDKYKNETYILNDDTPQIDINNEEDYLRLMQKDIIKKT